MPYSTGWGGEFYLHNGTALVKLLGVRSVDPGEETADEHEVTTLDAADRYKEFILGMIDPGEITVEINHVPNSATDQLCLAARAAGDSRAWKIVIPDSDGTPLRKFEGNGYVRSYRVSGLDANAPMTATLVIRCTGARSEAAA